MSETVVNPIKLGVGWHIGLNRVDEARAHLGDGDVGHGEHRLHALVADPGYLHLDAVPLVIVDHALVVIPEVINIIVIITLTL